MWLACAALLAACFTDAGVVSTSAGATGAATTPDDTTTATSATTSGTSEPATTTTSDATGTLTGADATTMSVTSGPSTTGDATTTSGSTGAPDTSTGGTTGGSNDLPVPGCEPLFYTDFSQDPAGVLQYSGGQWTWSVDTGELTVVTQTGSSFAWVADANWTDVTAYTRLRFGSGYGLLRARGQPNGPGYYYAGIAIQTQELRSGVSLNGQANTLDGAPTMIQPGVWYTLRLSLVGTKVTAEVADVSTSFDDPTFAAGSVSIGGYGSGTVAFDWLLVCKP